MRPLIPILAAALMAAPLAAMPDSASGNLQSARAALDRGDGIGAEADLRRALDGGAARNELAVDMGEAMLQQGDRAKAREWLAPGQFAKGQEARGWRLLGLLERLDGNLPAAGAALDRALAFSPDDPLLWVEIGRLRYQGGEQVQAAAAADKAVSLGPDNPRALELKAQMVRDSAGYAAALPWYERALAAAPDDLLLLGGYAASLGELGRAGEMLAITRRMIAIDPRQPQAFFLQAMLAARAGDPDLARAMLNRIGDEMDAVPAAQVLSGALELEAGNANAAIAHLTPVVDAQPTNQKAGALLAAALYAADDHRQLFDRFGPPAARGDAAPYMLTLLARSLEEQGDRAGAAALLDRTAAALPPQLLPIAGTGSDLRGMLSAGNTAGALQLAQRQLDQSPGGASALGQIGDAELLSGQADKAFAHYAQAAQVRFTDQLALRSAIALERSGRAGQIPALVGSYLAIYPESRLMARIAANLALGRKDWKAARALLENLKQRGGNRDARLLADLSQAQTHDGDAKAGLESARRAWQLAPASAFAAQALGLALIAAGEEPEAARQLIEQARKIGGDNPQLAAARKALG